MHLHLCLVKLLKIRNNFKMADPVSFYFTLKALEKDILRMDSDYSSSMTFALKNLEERDDIDQFLGTLHKAYEYDLKDRFLKDKLENHEIFSLRKATSIRQVAYENLERDFCDLTEELPFGDNFLFTEPSFNWHNALLERFESVI